jgi:glycosyltransferase involved in cell wall biosynthesis
MKFSIVIPTQNRPELLARSVHYALTQDYRDIELIVSDNSTSTEYKQKNKQKLEKYIPDERLSVVSPPAVLSPPEHFEFALQYATGDYVLYLTDKMMLLPDTLIRTEYAIRETGAEIVNWLDTGITSDEFQKTADTDILSRFFTRGELSFRKYDPMEELKIKATGFIPRSNQDKENYVTGKVCFGCFSRELIERIQGYSGGLFGGVTHDYSAMVQGLCLAKGCVILDSPGIIFVSLPFGQSWGMLTYLQSVAALDYYKSFSNPDAVLSSLFIPNLYSSQHNMVASDYVKYLGLYNKLHFFMEKYWLRSIGLDLRVKDRIWASEIEKKNQIGMFYRSLMRSPAALCYWYFYLVALHLEGLKTAHQTAFRGLVYRLSKKLLDTLPYSISSNIWLIARKVFKK